MAAQRNLHEYTPTGWRQGPGQGLGPQKTSGNSATSGAFIFFLALSTIIFMAPQVYLPWLATVPIGKIMAAIAIGAYLLAMVSSGNPLTIWGDEVKYVLILAILAFISIPLSRWPGGSLDYCLDLFLKSVMVFFLTANLLDSNSRISKFCWAFTVFSVFNAVTGISHYMAGTTLAVGRISGGFASSTDNPNDLALFLNLSLPIIWCLYKTSHHRIARLICLSAMALATVAIILTFSRGGFLTLCVMGMVLLRREARTFGLSAMMIIGAIVMILAIAPAGYTDRILSIAEPSKDETGSSEQRIGVMRQALNDMISHPQGSGIGMSILSSQRGNQGWISIHNVYLQVGVDLGVMGLITYLVMLWKSMKGLSQIAKGADPPNRFLPAFAGGVQLALLGYSVAAFFHPVAYHFYVYYLVGMALAAKQLAASGQENLREKTKQDGWGHPRIAESP